MALREFLTFAFALLACCAVALFPRHAAAGSTDAMFISSGGSTSATEAAPHDSEYAAAREMSSGMNTPEADARPGEY